MIFNIALYTFAVIYVYFFLKIKKLSYINTIVSLCIFGYIFGYILCDGYTPSQRRIHAYCTKVCESESFTDWLFSVQKCNTWYSNWNECTIGFVRMDAIFKLAFIYIITCLVFYFQVAKLLHSPPWSSDFGNVNPTFTAYMLLDLVCFVCIMNHDHTSVWRVPFLYIGCVLFMCARIGYIIWQQSSVSLAWPLSPPNVFLQLCCGKSRQN